MIWDGMNINIKATNLELTESIEGYVIKRVTNLGKMLRKFQDDGAEILVQFEVAKTSNNKQHGDRLYRADCKISINGVGDFYAHSEMDDLHAAIDDVKDKCYREIRKKKTKTSARFKKGAIHVKNMLKGLVPFQKK